MKTFYSFRDETGPGGCSWLLKNSYGMEEVQKPSEADVIIWNGGEDIGTSIYMETPVNRSIPFQPSSRDMTEMEMFIDFRGLPGKLLLGICRGSQLLNCLNGGKLYQDVDGHFRSHKMIDLPTGEILEVTSTHHQMMRPNVKDGIVIGISSMSSYKDSGYFGIQQFKPVQNLRNGEDVEIVWYPKTHSLCIQGHPEYVPNSRFASYTYELMQKCYSEIGQSCAA